MKKEWGKTFMMVLTLTGLLCLLGAESAFCQTTFQAYTRPQAVPSFSLENLQGKRVDIRDLLGRVIFLNFWATW